MYADYCHHYDDNSYYGIMIKLLPTLVFSLLIYSFSMFTYADMSLDSLKRKPRLGMTKDQLELIWGKPKETITVSGQRIQGLKKEHVKYFSKYWSGLRYQVDDLMLSVGFYDGKSIAISFYSTKGEIQFNEVEKIAKTLTKTGFSSRPANTNKYFSMYSDDLKQRYLFQKRNSYTVIDMELVKKQHEEPTKESTTKNL